MVRYLRTFTSERLLRYTLVFPVFIITTFQSVQVIYWTDDLLITHFANLIRLAYHNWVSSKTSIASCADEAKDMLKMTVD